jgi:hypothetical protein
MIPGDATAQLDSDLADELWLEALADQVEAGGHSEAEGAACARALDAYLGRTQGDEVLEASLNALHSLLNTLTSPLRLPGVEAHLNALSPDILEQAVNCLGSSGYVAYATALRTLQTHRDRGVASAARIGLCELGVE